MDTRAQVGRVATTGGTRLKMRVFAVLLALSCNMAVVSAANECAQMPGPCGTGQNCNDPDWTAAAVGDFTCTCAGNPTVGNVGGPAVCLLDECATDKCGAGQTCADPRKTAMSTGDFVCTCDADKAKTGVGQPAPGCGPTDAPPTDAPPTDIPDTDAPPTDIPATNAPPTDAPPTDAPPTNAPPTDVPDTDAPPTDVPATNAPPTEAPPTEAPPTAAPPTEAPPTEAPPTEAPPTEAPPTEAPPTEAPPTEAPPTEAPPTDVPDTAAPPTPSPPTDVPDTGAPSTDAPPPAASTPAPTPASTPTPVSAAVKDARDAASKAATAAGAFAAGAAILGGGAAGAATGQAVVFTALKCQVDDDDIELVVHPLQFKLGGEPEAGAVVGNILLSCAFALVTTLAVKALALTGRVGRKRARGFDGVTATQRTEAVLRYPSLMMTVPLVLFPGTLESALNLLVRPRGGAGVVLVGALGVAACLGFTAFLVRVVTRPAARLVCREESGPAKRFFLGDTVWESEDRSPLHVDRVGLAYDVYYNIGFLEGRYFACELIPLYFLAVIAAFQSADPGTCAVQAMLMLLVTTATAAFVLCTKVYISPFVTGVMALSNIFMAGGLLLHFIAFVKGDKEHWGVEYGTYMFTGALVMCILRALYDLYTIVEVGSTQYAKPTAEEEVEAALAAAGVVTGVGAIELSACDDHLKAHDSAAYQNYLEADAACSAGGVTPLHDTSDDDLVDGLLASKSTATVTATNHNARPAAPLPPTSPRSGGGGCPTRVLSSASIAARLAAPAAYSSLTSAAASPPTTPRRSVSMPTTPRRMPRSPSPLPHAVPAPHSSADETMQSLPPRRAATHRVAKGFREEVHPLEAGAAAAGRGGGLRRVPSTASSSSPRGASAGGGGGLVRIPSVASLLSEAAAGVAVAHGSGERSLGPRRLSGASSLRHNPEGRLVRIDSDSSSSAMQLTQGKGMRRVPSGMCVHAL